MGRKIKVKETLNKDFNFAKQFLCPPSKWRPWHVPCHSYILNTDSDIFNLENANQSQASIPPSRTNDAMAENDVNDTISC